VSTGGEMAVALAGGIDPSRIEVHGNNKSLGEIEKAISVGVESIVIDSLYEIDRVAAAAKKAGKVQRVLLRITPGIQAHTHESIATAHEDVKFGFSIASGAAWAAITAVHTHPSLELRGVHAHIGSQIFGYKSFEILSERLISLLAQYRDEFKSELPELDLGGGYGIAYLPGDETVNPAEAMNALAAAVTKNCTAHNLQIPRVSIEPGRGFWMHQFVEYFIAGGLVMMSAQLKEPAIPAAMGLIMLVNTAITDGLLSAFKWISRGVHRVIDWLIIIACLVLSFVADIETNGRLALLGVGVVLGVIVLGTNFAKRGAQPTPRR
jgi:hypothetical protein